MKEIVISIYNFSFLPLYTYPASLPPLLKFFPSLPNFLPFLLLIPLPHPYPASLLPPFFTPLLSFPTLLPSLFLSPPHTPPSSSHCFLYSGKPHPLVLSRISRLFNFSQRYISKYQYLQYTQYEHAYNK